MAKVTGPPNTEERADDQATRKQVKPSIEFGDPEGEPADPGSAHASFDRRLRLLEGGRSKGDDTPWWVWIVVGIIGVVALVPGAADWVKARASAIREQGPWSAT